jgi:hypothetical protein
VGLRDRLKRLQRATKGDTIAVRLRDGTTARFYADEVFPGAFVHEMDRGKRDLDGGEPGPAHPFVEALRDAAPGEVERLVPTHGTIVTLMLGEDEIMRGERERPGPPVEWDDKGQVCR